MNKIDTFNKKQLNKKLPEIRSGYTIKVNSKIKDGDKERIQTFEGLVIAKKHGTGISATITVRKISHGVGVERIFPLHSPSIESIEVVKKGKVRRAKLYYIRRKSAKESRLKTIVEKRKVQKESEKASSELDQPTKEELKQEKVAQEPKEATPEKKEEKPEAKAEIADKEAKK